MKELKELIVPGTELQRIREAANLSRGELASRLGGGGYKAGIVSLFEMDDRYAGLTMLKRWAEACGHRFRIVFEPDHSLPCKPRSQVMPKGWFATPISMKFHYDNGTGKSICGRYDTNEASLDPTAHDHPNNCKKCCQCRRSIRVIPPPIS